MSDIKGLEQIHSAGQLQQELQQGARFVVFPYCISLLVITFRRSSKVNFIPSGESAAGRALPYMLLSLALGWWGIPWGPIFTVQSLWVNFKGGENVTRSVLYSMRTT